MANHLFFHVHRKHFAAHLLFHFRENEVAQNVPEEKSENHREHCQQQVCNRGNKVAAHLLAPDDEYVSHLPAPFAANSSLGAAARSAALSPVSCKKTSSRLIAEGRSSFRSQTASTTARA